MMNIILFSPMTIFVILIIIEMSIFPYIKSSSKHKNIFRIIFGAAALFIVYLEVRYAQKMYFINKYKMYKVRIGAPILYNIMLIFFAVSFVYGVKMIVSLNNGKRNKSLTYLIVFIIFVTLSIVLGKCLYPYSNDGGSLAMVKIMFIILMIIISIMIYIGSFVYYDAKKRGMDALIWTLVAVCIPYFIGFIIYIIARSDSRKLCPVCRKPVSYEYKICPFCGAELNKKCPSCGKNVSSDWNVCPYCSNKLK